MKQSDVENFEWYLKVLVKHPNFEEVTKKNQQGRYIRKTIQDQFEAFAAGWKHGSRL